MSDTADEAEREWTRLARLLVGRDPDVSRFYLRTVVVLAFSQAVFTTALWALRDRGIPERNLYAFGTMLVLAGLGAAVYHSYRNCGVLVTVALVLAPLVGTLPVASLAEVQGLATGVLVVVGFGVWAGGVCYLLGRGLRRLRERILAWRRPG
jgi:hypothetical protein